MQLDEYKDRFKNVAVSRDEHGILTVTLHSRGGPLMWNGRAHRELSELWGMVTGDRENRVVVLTGAGDTFIGVTDHTKLTEPLVKGEVRERDWDHAVFEGVRLITHLLEVDVPVICALNGPAIAHSELAVLSDIVIAADHTYFQDLPHVQMGLVPGDGTQIIWPLLVGPNRARYFLLTGQKIEAAEALALGVVGEVLPAEKVLDRAYELARDIARRNPITMRSMRHVFVRPLRRAIMEDLHYGLSLESFSGLSGQQFYADAAERGGA
jgi:enoyl-CoA hydratase/carnithine racemase